jgi:predicted HicB family RNase H-like nuclease
MPTDHYTYRFTWSAEVVKDMRASGEAVPAALAEKHCSGAFRVRIPPEVQQTLATQAAEQGVRLI